MTEIWETPITNRSRSDIEKLIELMERDWLAFTDDEKDAWRRGMRGAMNVSDFARILNNIHILSEVLELDLPDLAIPYIISNSFSAKLLEQVGTIREAYGVYKSTPQLPSIPLNTFDKWNDIEHILQDVYNLLLNNFHHYCGEDYYAGEETGLLL